MRHCPNPIYSACCVASLLERAGQRAAEVERQAAQDIESFASQQLAEAEASEGQGALATAGAVGAAGSLLRERARRWWAPPGPSTPG